MGWQRTLPAVRAVWLLIAAQAIVAAVAADVGLTNEGMQTIQLNNDTIFGCMGVSTHKCSRARR